MSNHELRITTGSCQRTGVLLISGTQAREWGGPDILINLAADLLEAWSVGTGLVYGGKSFTAAEVRRILERVELIVFPDFILVWLSNSSIVKRGYVQHEIKNVLDDHRR